VSENKTAAYALSRMGDAIHFERWGHPNCDVRQSLPQAGAIGYSTEDAIALRDWLIRQFPLPPAPLPADYDAKMAMALDVMTKALARLAEFEALAKTEYEDGYCSVTGDPARHMIAARQSEESCDPMCTSCSLAALHRPAEEA
jgi:hypothetical protein